MDEHYTLFVNSLSEDTQGGGKKQQHEYEKKQTTTGNNDTFCICSFVVIFILFSLSFSLSHHSAFIFPQHPLLFLLFPPLAPQSQPLLSPQRKFWRLCVLRVPTKEMHEHLSHAPATAGKDFFQSRIDVVRQTLLERRLSDAARQTTTTRGEKTPTPVRAGRETFERRGFSRSQSSPLCSVWCPAVSLAAGWKDASRNLKTRQARLARSRAD